MKAPWPALMIVLILLANGARAAAEVSTDLIEADALLEAIFGLASRDTQKSLQSAQSLRETWHSGYAAMCMEISQFADVEGRKRIFRLLEEQTGEHLGTDPDAWWRWIWSEPRAEHPSYALFKSTLYRQVDPKFGAYFDAGRKRTIRLDEVRWGGVKQDGIPPLRKPKMISAQEATYLEDDNVVFGLEVNGDARAYPKRILAWHEMFTDIVGGEPVVGVYCTLCGTMILYETTFEGTDHRLGTSGFLYRSNKLMYDQATQSLWSTIEGEPVIGPLVEKGIHLKPGAVVTTTWGAWQQRHPDTRVLALTTGYQRDYSEGAAYRDYFATDELMFSVPELDDRLANKAEILAIDLGDSSDAPLAVSAVFLLENPVWHSEQGGTAFVVLTDPSGANRVYAVGEHRFVSWDQDRTAVDSAGLRWRVSEVELRADDDRRMPRLPAHRAFWFGWRAAHPDTRLVH